MAYERDTGWTSEFRGVVAALATPMVAGGGIDFNRVTDLVELVIAAGVSGVMVGGTTGEFVTLTNEERATLTRWVIEVVDHRVRVFAHVGHADVRIACALAEEAVTAGADALSAVTPYYHRVSLPAIEQMTRELLAIDPGRPFFVYDYPDATGAVFPVELVERLLDHPNLAGVKCSVGSLEELARWQRLPDVVCVMSGNDAFLRQFVADGGRAIVSGNATAVPEVVVRAFAAASAGAVDSPWYGLLETLVAAGRGGAPDRLKAILGRRGIDVGPARIRTHLPSELPADDDATVGRLIDAVSSGSHPTR